MFQSTVFRGWPKFEKSGYCDWHSASIEWKVKKVTWTLSLPCEPRLPCTCENGEIARAKSLLLVLSFALFVAVPAVGDTNKNWKKENESKSEVGLYHWLIAVARWSGAGQGFWNTKWPADRGYFDKLKEGRKLWELIQSQLCYLN